MTVAVCVKCGAMKFGALVECRLCGCLPLSTEDEFIYSIVLSDHYFKHEVLSEISDAMLNGRPMPRLSKEQEDAARLKFIGQYAQAKAMLLGENRATDELPLLTKKRGWKRIFGR
jgi:hypothetical protein